MTGVAPGKSKRSTSLWVVAGVGVLILLGANAHMAYVAIATDPGCVPHIKEKGDAPGEYRAAKSSC